MSLKNHRNSWIRIRNILIITTILDLVKQILRGQKNTHKKNGDEDNINQRLFLWRPDSIY